MERKEKRRIYRDFGAKIKGKGDMAEQKGGRKVGR